jgi:hypothetical protein
MPLSSVDNQLAEILAERLVVDLTKEFGVSVNNADNAPLINNALRTLGLQGLTAFLPPGVYNIQSTINIGDGATNTDSTYSAKLVGGGYPNWNPPGTGFTNTPSPVSTTLKWTGGGGLDMVRVNGPLQGWGLENLLLDGNGLCTGGGLSLISAQFGVARNLALQGSYSGITWTTQAPGSPTAHHNTMHNRFENIQITWTGHSGGGTYRAMLFNSGLGAGTNSCYETMENVTVVVPTSSVGCTQIGVELGYCDSIDINHLHYYGNVAGSDTKQWLRLNGTVQSGKPANCSLNHVDFGSNTATIVSNGTPGINRITDILALNGIPPDPRLPLFEWGVPNILDSTAVKGTATLVAGSVVVSDTTLTANSKITLKSQTPGGTPGALTVSAKTNGTGFTITSTSGADTSVVAWEHTEE